MTSADLQALLDAEDAEGCIVLFAKATEADRRKLAKTAAAQLKALMAEDPPSLTDEFHGWSDAQYNRLSPAGKAFRKRLRPAQVAVLATALPSELKKFGSQALPPIDDMVAVLSARRPEWVGEWVEMILSWGQLGRWDYIMFDWWCVVRRLIREGLCARPRSALYIQWMVQAIQSPYPESKGVYQGLLDDPELLNEEVWESLETEPRRGQSSLFPMGPDVSPEDRWETALAQLADEGRLSRTRLLDACLGTLERDYPEVRARWFALMHETLRPTLDEQAERAGRYVGLAASRNASTVTFALKALAELDKAKRLDPALVVAGVGPALLARTKGTVRSALDLIDHAARRAPEVRARVAALAVDALTHESPDVQKAALDLIERHGDQADLALRELLRARQETVAASLRARLESWLGAEPAPTPVPAATAAEEDGVLARAFALDPELARRSGVAAALEVLVKQGGGEVPALELLETEVPRLDPERRIVPVADLDELIGLFATVLENTGDADEVERLFDGVARLCDRTPGDFAVRTGPIRARAEKRDWIKTPLAEPLCDLAMAWITGQASLLTHVPEYGSLRRVVVRHVHGIAQRVARRQAGPLLSAPTHRGGWIDPRVLVERVRCGVSTTLPTDSLDESLALLRLAPDPGPRAEALRAAEGLKGSFAEALRYALGGTGETVGADPQLWVAAARARAPFADDPLVEARHPGLGPDAGRVGHCTFRPGPGAVEDWRMRFVATLVAHEPPLPSNYDHDLPTVLFHDHRALLLGPEVSWGATLWPLNREPFFAAGAEWLVGRDCTPSEALPYRPYLEPLLDPDVPLHPMAGLLLAGTLSANTVELQGLAVDVLVAAVDDGRLDGRLLGEALLPLLTEGGAKPSRLAKALGDAARVSAMHARVVVGGLHTVLAGLSTPPKDLHVLLELLKELLVETGGSLATAASTYLKGLKVSGKTAKLAKDLLGIAGGSDNASSRRAAAARALTGRLERAERWGRCQQEHGV